MKKQTIVLSCIAAVLVSATIVATYFYKKSDNEKREILARDQSIKALLNRPGSISLGSERASVTLVEFFDPECETCRMVYPAIKELLKSYEGKVRLVMRYMPLHPNSIDACLALEAAQEEDRYWDLLDVMFARQPEWADHHQPKPELVRTYAKEIGLDLKKFDLAVRKEEYRSKILQDKKDGETLGVRATPTFFVNGRYLQELSYESMNGLINEEIAKAAKVGD